MLATKEALLLAELPFPVDQLESFLLLQAQEHFRSLWDRFLPILYSHQMFCLRMHTQPLHQNRLNTGHGEFGLEDSASPEPALPDSLGFGFLRS